MKLREKSAENKVESKIHMKIYQIIIDKFRIRFKFILNLFCCIEMAGGGAADNPNLKGLSRIFNAETNVGRANVRPNISCIISIQNIYLKKIRFSTFSAQKPHTQ